MKTDIAGKLMLEAPATVPSVNGMRERSRRLSSKAPGADQVREVVHTIADPGSVAEGPPSADALRPVVVQETIRTAIVSSRL